ncbi:hypothetical protein [Henriciella sp.]|uniref:hypothetical protein n=1 Tax=Henriciella sp. TaxID=1968823 RepID=UPI0026248201|nr:hypothetical protein [Henriciella sp.]
MRSYALAITILIILAFLALPVSARDTNDAIKAYNAAMTGGDAEAKLQTAEVLGQTAIAESSRRDAPLLALEAAKTLCLYGDCKSALSLTDWISSHAGGDGQVSKTEVALVDAFARWRTQPSSASRAALDKALVPFIEGDLSTLTLAAFQHRYTYDASKQRWAKAMKSANEASTHFEPFRGAIAQQWSEAEMMRIIADFNATPSANEVIAMAEHHVAVSELIGQYTVPKPDWLFDHFYLTLAWENALMAYFDSGYSERRWSNLPEEDVVALKANQRALMREALSPGAAIWRRPGTEDDYSHGDLPFCSGHFDKKPAIKYGGMNAYRGQFGSVVLRVDIENAKVSDLEILAAVPAGQFEDEAIDAISQWTWVVESGTPGVTCRTSQKNFIQEVIFHIE